MMPKNYTIGLAFSENGDEIVLIRKNRPAQHAGKLNGPGGEIKQTDASIFAAQVREFEEETYVENKAEDWFFLQPIPALHGGHVAVLCAFDDKFLAARTRTDEEVMILKVEKAFARTDLMPDLDYLMQKALDSRYPKISRPLFPTRKMA